MHVLFVCICVCMYCLYVCVYACIVCMCVCMCACVHVRENIYVCVYLFLCIFVCIHYDVHMHACVRVLYVYIYMCMYVCMQVFYVCVHTCIMWMHVLRMYAWMCVCVYVCVYVQYALPFINCKLSSQRFTTYHNYWDGCKIVWKAVGLRELPWDRLSTHKFSSCFQRGLEAISRVLLSRLIAVKHSQTCELETASFRSSVSLQTTCQGPPSNLTFMGLPLIEYFSSANLENGSRVFDLKRCEVTDVRSVQ